MEDWKVEERIMQDLVRILREGEHSLVIYGNEKSLNDSSEKNLSTGADSEKKISTYDGRGVSDLFRLLNEEPEILEDAYIADKIVGKGAAALISLAKVREVYADIITLSAQAMLELHDVRVRYGRMVPHITSRNGTGFCPVEIRCLPCKTPEECLVQIKGFIEEMKSKTNETR